MGDIGADQGANSSGIDIGDTREVDDECGGIFGPKGGLELEECSEHDRSLETQDPLAGAGTTEIFNMKGLLGGERHPKILAVRPCAIVTSLLILGGRGRAQNRAGLGWQRTTTQGMARERA
jgi:hypothetical protein